MAAAAAHVSFSSCRLLPRFPPSSSNVPSQSRLTHLAHGCQPLDETLSPVQRVFHVPSVSDSSIAQRSSCLRATPSPCPPVRRRRLRRNVSAMASEVGAGGGGGEIGGRLRREVLEGTGRAKLDYSSDRDFYAFPRFVTHVDDAFLGCLTRLYRERVPAGSEVLDLMSSWVSHLPPDVEYKRVVGHGLNAAELARNRQLSSFFVKDLNQEQKLEFADGSFDAVLCTVSVQYLQQPEKVFAEIYRILRPGGVCIVSFSNRMFYQKAIAAWRENTAFGRIQLVRQYLQCVTGFTEPEVVREVPSSAAGRQEAGDAGGGPLQILKKTIGSLFQRAGQDPFYAVIAYRNFKPI